MVRETPEHENKPCRICGGTGQMGEFRGVSRFVISFDDCPDCHGTGIEIDEHAEARSPATENKAAEHGNEEIE